MILLCTATGVEARACRSAIRKSGSSARFEVLQTGMGVENAEKSLRSRLALGSLPSLIVSTGFAGSTHPDLKFGDWVAGKSIRFEEGPKYDLPDFSRIELLKTSKPFWKISDFLTVSQAKSEAREGDPVALDMESSAWDEIAREFQIPFLILRLLSDTPDFPLPRAVGSFTAGILAKSYDQKAKLWSQGLSQTLTHPLTMANFLARSAQLPPLLEKGIRLLCDASRVKTPKGAGHLLVPFGD